MQNHFATSVRLAVIDYDTGNLHSACKGLEYVGAKVEVVDCPDRLAEFDGLVLPGDGAFDPAIQELRSRGFEDPIRNSIAAGKPFLGICIGMQLLFEHSEEGSEPGLGIVPGQVKRFQPEKGITIPHMGWNPIHLIHPADPFWIAVPPNSCVYFVHSYYVEPTDPSWIAASVTHGSQTVAAVIKRDHVVATQFHPEKSGPVGLVMLRNFVKYVDQRIQGSSTPTLEQ